MLVSEMRGFASQILSVLRITTAGSFFTHGTMKLVSWPEQFEFPMSPLMYMAGTLEVIGGLLLIGGLFIRPTAFVLSGMMAVAYFYAHAPNGFFPVLNHGEAAMLYCFIFLYLAFAGGGAWSIDVLMDSKRSAHSTS